MEQARLINISTSTVHEIPSTLNKFLIGRGLHCTLVLDDMNVSRTHCILERNNGDWYISDKSSNGTWVNGKLVDKSKSQLLAIGDLIGLSDTIRFMYNKTSQQIADNTSEKALSENDIMDIAESVIAEADALNAEFENDFDIAEANAPNAELPNNVFNSENVEETRKGLNVVSGNGSVNIYYPAVVNIVQKSVPGQPTIPQLLKPVVAYEQAESSSTQPEPVIQPPPNTGNSQEPSCSKDTSIVKTERDHFEQVEDELQCSICTEMFVKAVTLNCSHTFCKYCIAQWQQNQTICPICRTKITMKFPTLVVDNFIEKVLESASEEVKQHRRELIAEREATAAASTSCTVTESTSESSPRPSRRRRAEEPIEIGDSDDGISVDGISVEEDEDDDDDQDDCDEDEYDLSDEDDDMDLGTSFDEWGEDYNGVPGCYYGGYGRCYGCGQRGHWANGCPNRRKR